MTGPVKRSAIPDSRDDEEREARRLEEQQNERWYAAGRQITFFQRDDEITVLWEIRRLKKISASYQRRYGYPPSGISDRD